MNGARLGTTLIETLVVILILALLASVAVANWPRRRDERNDHRIRIRQAQLQSVREFRPVTVWLQTGDSIAPLTALPDGSVLGSTVSADTSDGASR